MLLTTADLSICQQAKKPLADVSKAELKKHFDFMVSSQKILKKKLYLKISAFL